MEIRRTTTGVEAVSDVACLDGVMSAVSEWLEVEYDGSVRLDLAGCSILYREWHEPERTFVYHFGLVRRITGSMSDIDHNGRASELE